jgi:membrane fusion protein (multidrug efflux system)
MISTRNAHASILVQAVLAVSLVLLAACGKKDQAPTELPAAEVTVAPVILQDVPIVAEFVGQTESSRQVEIRARVSGYLDRRLYVEGSLVQAGKQLFQIDPKPFEASLAAAKAEVAQRTAAHETALANMKRVLPLAEKNAVSLKDRDDAVGQERSTAATLEAAKANVIQAELNLSYTHVATPVTGLASFAKVSEGTYVDAQNNLLTYVAALSPMRVNFSISENQQLQIRDAEAKGTLKMPGQQKIDVEVVLADDSIFPEHGKLTFADASFSQETGTFLVRAEVENAKGLLRPGQFVRIRLKGVTRPNGILVPQRAVLQTAKGNLAFVVGADNKAQVRPVTIEAMSGENWLVGSGLKAGDQLVVDGGMKLQPDVPVKIVKRVDPVRVDTTAQPPVVSKDPNAAQSAAAGK